jgi:protein TonB
MNEKRLRLIIFIFAGALHLGLILFLAFETGNSQRENFESARVMKVTDLTEIVPLPPPPSPSEINIPQVEDLAEVMIETDVPVIQEIVPAGTLNFDGEEVYLPMHLVSVRPQLDIDDIISDMIYPPIAHRMGIEGRVLLELSIDRTGFVRMVIILLEEPEGRGFGEAAVRAFSGRRGTPAMANGEPVSCRFRYPVVFTIR